MAHDVCGKGYQHIPKTTYTHNLQCSCLFICILNLATSRGLQNMLQAIGNVFRLALGLSIIIASKLVKQIKSIYWTLYTQVWDVQLHLANQFAPELDPSKVIPTGIPGANGAFNGTLTLVTDCSFPFSGDWSRFTYLPPTETVRLYCRPRLR